MRIKMIMFYILIGFVLTNYQNCAPSGDVLDQEVLVVDGIDQVSVGAISFPQAKLTAFMGENFVASGLCDQSGARISWRLLDSEGVLIERGLAECDLGSFKIELSNEWQSYCGDELIVEAALGAKASSQFELEASCD